MNERDGYATATLVHKHSSHYRPVEHYLRRLDAMVRGMPACLRSMIDKSASIVPAHDSLFVARRSGYEAIILVSTHITLRRSPPLNPARFLPVINDVSHHDCHAVISECTSPRPDLLQTPIPNSDMILYTDGSASRPSDNGYAVVTDFHVLEANALPQHTSAQAAELIALTRACVLARGKVKVATVYTDSRYTFSVAHDFGKNWKMRGFVTSSGKPLQHHVLINDLLNAILLPSKLAIVTCCTHKQ